MNRFITYHSNNSATINPHQILTLIEADQDYKQLLTRITSNLASVSLLLSLLIKYHCGWQTQQHDDLATVLWSNYVDLTSDSVVSNIQSIDKKVLK